MANCVSRELNRPEVSTLDEMASSDPAVLLLGRDLELSYGSTPALRGVTAGIAAGEVLAVMGPSGCGKSTLLLCLAGLLQPDAGSVSLDGRDITHAPPSERAALRRTAFGFVFQGAELVPELTLRENISLPLELTKHPRAETTQRVDEVIDSLGLSGCADRRPREVSGGQAQRGAVGRALVHRPAVLFADEPTGALDSVNGELVFTALLELAAQSGSAVLLVTHDKELAARTHRVVHMKDGQLLSEAE